MYEDALKRATDRGVECYQFADRLVAITSDEPDELRAMIGALLLERERRPVKPWWRFW